MVPMRFPVTVFLLIGAPKKKKPTFTSALATWASELFRIYTLSSETCWARAVVGATRSVACARTTGHLATSAHRENRVRRLSKECQITVLLKICFEVFKLLIHERCA